MIRHHIRASVATPRHGVFADSKLAALALAGLMMTVAGSLAIRQTNSPDDIIMQTVSSAATGSPVREEMTEWGRRMQTFEARVATA